MTRNLSTARRLAHVWLLLAALLQFGTAALGPWAHLASLELDLAPSWQASGPESPAGGSGHHEGDCAVCHSLTVAVFLPVASATPLSLRAVEERVPDPIPPTVSSFVALPGARGPPAA